MIYILMKDHPLHQHFPIPQLFAAVLRSEAWRIGFNVEVDAAAGTQAESGELRVSVRTHNPVVYEPRDDFLSLFRFASHVLHQRVQFTQHYGRLGRG